MYNLICLVVMGLGRPTGSPFDGRRTRLTPQRRPPENRSGRWDCSDGHAVFVQRHAAKVLSLPARWLS